jgi:hypothetical protein
MVSAEARAPRCPHGHRDAITESGRDPLTTRKRPGRMSAPTGAGHTPARPPQHRTPSGADEGSARIAAEFPHPGPLQWATRLRQGSVAVDPRHGRRRPTRQGIVAVDPAAPVDAGPPATATSPAEPAASEPPAPEPPAPDPPAPDRRHRSCLQPHGRRASALQRATPRAARGAAAPIPLRTPRAIRPIEHAHDARH